MSACWTDLTLRPTGALGEGARRRRRTPVPPACSACRVAASTVPVTGSPLACWNRLTAFARHLAVDAVDPTADVLAGVDEELLELLHGRPARAEARTAEPPPDGAGRRPARAAAAGGEAERRAVAWSTDAGDGQALVALERLDRGLGGRAEVAVDAVLHPDADPVQGFLEGPDVVAAGALASPTTSAASRGPPGRTPVEPAETTAVPPA